MDRCIETFSRLDYRMDDMIVETREYITGSRWLALAAWWEQWARWREEFRSRRGFYLADSAQGKFCGLWASYLISTDAVDLWMDVVSTNGQKKFLKLIQSNCDHELDIYVQKNLTQTDLVTHGGLPRDSGSTSMRAWKNPKSTSPKNRYEEEIDERRKQISLFIEIGYIEHCGVSKRFFSGTTFFSWNQILNVERNDFFSRTFF